MSRRTLVLLPGLMCDGAVWAAQREALASFDCVVPDYGLTPTLTGMAAGVLDAVAADRFALVGHSMGARVALEILRTAPHRVERVALMDTGLDPVAPGAAGEAERARRMALLDTARRDGMLSMARQWAPGMVHPARLDSPVYAEVLEMVCRATPDVFAAHINALLQRPDARDVLAGADCPVLLACGRQDSWSPLARHEAMQRLKPSARLVVIEESGHMAPMEQPVAVTAALQAWLQTG